MYRLELSRETLDLAMRQIVEEKDLQRYEEKLRDIIQLATAYLTPIIYATEKESETLLQSVEPFDKARVLVRQMKEEFDYLKWFFGNCDFGPAHGDIIYLIQQEYEEETGRKVPEAYRLDN